MRRLKCSIILIATILLVANADDEWRRVDTGADKSRSPSPSVGWSRSSTTGNRVPFVPEDMALPPPWLLPNQQPQMGFPAAQAQVRSFFDEEPMEWPPLASSKLIKPSSHAVAASKQSDGQTDLPRTSLQPPPSFNRFRPVASASSIAPVQHTWTYDNERSHPSAQQSWPAPDHQRLNQQVAKLAAQVAKKNFDQTLPSTSSAELNDPYRSKAQVEESKSAGQQQQQQQQRRRHQVVAPSAGRKSVSAFDDSSDLNDSYDGSLISTRSDNQPTYSQNRPAPSTRTQPRPSTDDDIMEFEREQQTFDSAKTASRSPVVRQKQKPVEIAIPSSQTKQQTKQRQQQQPSERNPPVVAVREEPPQAERPSSTSAGSHSASSQPFEEAGQSNQRQFHETYPDYENDNWPAPQQRPKSPKSRHPHYPNRPEPVTESQNIRSRNRPKSTVVPPLKHNIHSQEDDRDHHYQSSPRHPHYPAEEDSNYDPPNYDPPSYNPPSYEQEDQYKSPYYSSQRPRRPTTPRPEYNPYQNDPVSVEQPEENSAYDDNPYDEHREEPPREPEYPAHENAGYTEEPATVPTPSRRPSVPTQSPPVQQTGEQFNGPSDFGFDGDSTGDFKPPGGFNGPPPRPPPHHPPRRPNRPPPHLQRPRESVVTQGLNTLKSLVGIQSGPPRPRHPPPNGFGGPPNRGRRPPHPPYPGGDPFGNNFGDLGRQDQSDDDLAGLDSEEHLSPVASVAIDDTMEHRSNSGEDLAPSASSSTESTKMTTTQKAIRVETPTVANPPSTTAAPAEEPKSTLFPPFSKRVRPSPPSASTTENKAKNGKDVGTGQLRITSYKQRIEAMKERAKLREQQQAQPKNDADLEQSDSAESVVSSTTSTSTTTTVRPSTTRPKLPPRMTTRKPVTSAPSRVSSTTTTTESVPVAKELEKSDEETPFEQYKRRFKPKPSGGQARRPLKEDDPEPAGSGKDQQEEAPVVGKKNLFGKLGNRRRIQQQQQQKEDVAVVTEETVKPVVKESTTPVALRYFKDNKRRPANSRTTAAPVVESLPDTSGDEESFHLPTYPSPDLTPETQVPVQAAGSMPDEEEAPKIELESVASVNDEKNKKEESTENDSNHPDVNHDGHPAPSVFSDKLEDPQEQDHPVMDEEADHANFRQHPFFAMATNDPILPIEELLNIRVRDNGKDM